MEVQAHAARTQHSSFSESTEEIKPLTEEEKQLQKEKLVYEHQIFDCIILNETLNKSLNNALNIGKTLPVDQISFLFIEHFYCL